MSEVPPPPGAAHYTVSVRALCAFTGQRGDLDRRFTPSATALEGIQGQQGVALRRGADYETEIALETVHDGLRVRGRADGYDPRRHTLEEIKTIRGLPQDIPENRRQLHWAQLQTYGALFCRARGLDELALALVYVDVASQAETELRQVYGAAELDALFRQRCADFRDWAAQEARHRTARDAALSAMGFPQPAFRPGQRALAEAVYRAAVNGRCLLAQAPTGIGKTIGTLFPLLHAMPRRGVDKLAYLTCKGTGRLPALEALEALRAATPGEALRVVALVPKDQACEHPDKACHPQSCPLARGFYDRLPAARAQAVAEGWLDPAAQRRVARTHGLCPYYLGQELVRWADVLVGDVHHVFDTHGHLWGLVQAREMRLSIAVDEAHNLVERTRQMYSAELRLGVLQSAASQAPGEVRGPLHQLLQAAQALVADCDTPYAVLDPVPEAFVRALQSAVGALAEHFHQQPLATGPLLTLFFGLQRFLRGVDTLGEHALFDVQRESAEPAAQAGEDGAAPDAAEATLSVRNVVPAPYLRPRFQALQGATLFSATLSPPDHAVRLLGLPADTAWIDVPPAFAPEHLQVRVADGISTRYADRARSLALLAAVMARQFDAHPGNYLAFFSSFEYLDKAAAQLQAQRPDIPQWRQDRRMAAEARQDFLARFTPAGRGIGFAVLGGVFAEGVDLPGARLIGAFIATLALPPVSPVQDAMAARLERLFGVGSGDADLVPAMHKVVQAAGRVLRTPDDRGWLWLLDDRYRRPEVRALLPPGWQPL